MCLVCVCQCVRITWLELDLQFAHRVVVSKETQLSVQGVQSDSSFQAGERFTCRRAEGKSVRLCEWYYLWQVNRCEAAALLLP